MENLFACLLNCLIVVATNDLNMLAVFRIYIKKRKVPKFCEAE